MDGLSFFSFRYCSPIKALDQSGQRRYPHHTYFWGRWILNVVNGANFFSFELLFTYFECPRVSGAGWMLPESG
jgi:hypothetical protein